MPYQLINLRIDKIIAHEVYKRTETRDVVQPKCSHDFTQLDSGGLSTLQERIVNTLGDESYCIEMSIAQEDSTSAYGTCCQLLGADNNTFKSLSNQLANKLALSQLSRRIPGGILVIFDGLVGNLNHRYIGLIKAEIHSGFSLQETDGNLLLKFLSDLLLTPQQKLYKIALFIEVNRPSNPELRTPGDFKVLVYDHNMTRFETRQAAQYFYETFLGCSFSPSDKKLTSDFYHDTREFIQSLPIGDEAKLDINSSLYTYLKVAQSNISTVSDFADQYLEPPIRDNYNTFMIGKGLPEHAFTKDITYIKNFLKRRNLRFTSGVKISAPSQRFDDLVRVTGRDGNKTVVHIEGTIEREG
jgi:hypothetical protein